MDRIQLHARFIQSCMLGSETDLNKELIEKLSQVWLLMRSDDSSVLEVSRPSDQGPSNNQGPSILASATSHPIEHENTMTELSAIVHDTQPSSQRTGPATLESGSTTEGSESTPKVSIGRYRFTPPTAENGYLIQLQEFADFNRISLSWNEEMDRDAAGNVTFRTTPIGKPPSTRLMR